jgi:methylated-DNA-[protein]-cysteine S-methyltransferase
MAERMRLLVDRAPTPIGELVIIADTAGNLRTIDWTDHEERLYRLLGRQYGESGFVLEAARDPGGLTGAMRSYFAGELSAIERLPAQTAGTPFQQQVWSALRSIPCGSTLSYAELARRIGRPSAVRAVGLANGSNPVSIVVPCHRVIGSNGTLTGYGGGLERKRWLLAHEGALPAALV